MLAPVLISMSVHCPHGYTKEANIFSSEIGRRMYLIRAIEV